MRFLLAILVGKLANCFANIFGKNKTYNISGRKALKIDKNMISHFKDIDGSKVLLVTGTTGKSTAILLINHILTESEKKVISNVEGDIISSILLSSSLRGKLSYDYMVFEVDENELEDIYSQLPAAQLLITNLQKGEIIKHGDTEKRYEILRRFLKGKDIKVYLNNEEPRSKSFESIVKDIVTYGVDKNEKSFTKNGSFVTVPCPKCYEKINFEQYNLDGIGAFICPDCGHKSDALPMHLVERIDFENKTFLHKGRTFNMPYTMPFMLYNYASAIAVSKNFAKLEDREIEKAISKFQLKNKPIPTLKYKEKKITYFNVGADNSELLQSYVNRIAEDETAKMICLGLGKIESDKKAYASTAYTYDCDFSRIVHGNVEEYYCFSKTVCFDLANRLIYEGADPKLIKINDTDDAKKVLSEISKVKTDNVYLISNENCYLELKKLIKKEG